MVYVVIPHALFEGEREFATFDEAWEYGENDLFNRGFPYEIEEREEN